MAWQAFLSIWPARSNHPGVSHPAASRSVTNPPGEELSADRAALIHLKRIARLVGLPPTYFRQLYHDQVLLLAAYLRSLPDTTSCPDEVIDYALGVAERALNIRQRYLLPEKTAPEDVARKSDRWTYGVFLAAILHDLEKHAARSGGITSEELAETARSLVPEVGLAWISTDLDLMTAWQAALAGDAEKAGTIGLILAQAIRQDPANELVADDTSSVDDNPLQSFPSGMRDLIDSGRLLINRSNAHGWATDTDLWLDSKRSIAVISDWLIEETNKLPMTYNKLTDQLQHHGFLLPNPKNHRAVWAQIVDAGDDDRRECRLFRLPLEIIWPNPDDRPRPFAGTITPAT